MEGGSFSKCGSRLSAAHIRLKNLQQLQGSRAVPFQNGALALAPHTFVIKLALVSTIEGGWFSKLGSRLSAAHIRLKNLQQFQGSRAVPFQNVALALAPRTFV